MTDLLRRLLDAVLDESRDGLGEMAAATYTSPFHFARSVRAGAGESPVALRRRVTLERAAWELQRGATVTDSAFAAGYASVEGFSRAFARAYGHPPTAMIGAERSGHWLPAPNGIHFHSPTVLYIDSGEESAGDVLLLQVQHDVADIAALLDAAAGLSDDALAAVRLPGSAPRHWDGADESLVQVLWHLVSSKQPWLASIAGDAMPDMTAVQDVSALASLHDHVSARWLATIRDIEHRRGWADWIVDALCEPPESFRLAQIVAHELTFSAHRRLLVRWMLADAGVDVSTPALDPDPIMWQRRTSGGESR
ncbi:helix-turn-helix domain-containing protein [Gordonia liuliyuniae]|uniref:Helix-turn-helix domain-containing protein n=1 Tax=Gordonia liuliyuniae TaxID=2911517 RepID=A0ABS9INX9_9ACTN|nr:helix-turn-helix domain-containing protein [Gordonia liuliyuniae]MCF8587263.1 helix-turn-helix domain-containing protein [Gordonia liuliyuniae]